MIVCDLSEVEVAEDGRRIRISGKISGALGLFAGQTLFASFEDGSRQLFLSTIKLNPSVNYFRVFSALSISVAAARSRASTRERISCCLAIDIYIFS